MWINCEGYFLIWNVHLFSSKLLPENTIVTLLYLLTYCTEQSPSWEANWFSASQDIPRILRNLKVHYRIRKCLPPVPILSQPDPVHTPTSYFLKIHLNITLPSAPWSTKWSISLRFPHQNPVHASPLPHTRYMPCPSHSRFYHLNNIGRGVQIITYLLTPWSGVLLEELTSKLCS